VRTPRSHTDATPAPPASFARRHPILTGFGILAGLSLFATYFPLSAIVTGIVVGGHATGLDRRALHIAERFGGWVQTRFNRGSGSPAAHPTVEVEAPKRDARLEVPAPAASLRSARRIELRDRPAPRVAERRTRIRSQHGHPAKAGRVEEAATRELDL
jgi:hypothetical protein